MSQWDWPGKAGRSKVLDVSSLRNRTGALLADRRLEQIDCAGTLETEVVPIRDDLRDRLRGLGYIP